MTKILRVLGILEQTIKAGGSTTLAEIEDKILDAIEDKIAETSTPIDDRLVLPVIKFVRFIGNIADNDEEPNLEVVK